VGVRLRAALRVTKGERRRGWKAGRLISFGVSFFLSVVLRLPYLPTPCIWHLSSCRRNRKPYCSPCQRPHLSSALLETASQLLLKTTHVSLAEESAYVTRP
jgi:hypothetical protein